MKFIDFIIEFMNTVQRLMKNKENSLGRVIGVMLHKKRDKIFELETQIVEDVQSS